MTDGKDLEPGVIEAKLEVLEEIQKSIANRIADVKSALETSKHLDSRRPTVDLKEELERLPWIPARSGKCDVARDVPKDLVAAVRSRRTFLGGDSMYWSSPTELTLFRAPRPRR